MKTIYKYPLQVLNEQTLMLPQRAALLTVQVQHDRPCLWALIDNERPQEAVRIRTVGTGHEFPDAESWAHLASYQLDGGMLVFHVFRQVR